MMAVVSWIFNSQSKFQGFNNFIVQHFMILCMDIDSYVCFPTWTSLTELQVNYNNERSRSAHTLNSFSFICNFVFCWPKNLYLTSSISAQCVGISQIHLCLQNRKADPHKCVPFLCLYLFIKLYTSCIIIIVGLLFNILKG